MTSSPLNQLQVLKHQLSLFVAFHASLLSFFLIYISPSVPHSLPKFFLHLSVSSITFIPPFLSLSRFADLPLPTPRRSAGMGLGGRPAAGAGGAGLGEDGERGGRAGSHASSPQDAVPPLQLRGETLPPPAIHSSPSGYSWLSAPHRSAPAAVSSYTDLVLASLLCPPPPLAPGAGERKGKGPLAPQGAS